MGTLPSPRRVSQKFPIRNESSYDIIIETTGANALLDRALECLAGEGNEKREMMRRGVVYLIGGRDKVEYTKMLAHPKEATLMHNEEYAFRNPLEIARVSREALEDLLNE